jgi:hypothetical protein
MANQDVEAISVSCAGCGAQLEIVADVDTVVCSFCGNVNAILEYGQCNSEVEDDDSVKLQLGKRSIIPLGASLEDLEYQIYFLLANHVEGPSDLLDQMRITTRELMYVPTYVFEFGYSTSWSASIGTPNKNGFDWHFASGAESGEVTVAQYAGGQLQNAPLNPLQLLNNVVSKGVREEFSQSRLAGYKSEEFVISIDQATEQGDENFSRAVDVDLKKRLPGKAHKDVQSDGKFTSEKVTECYVPLCYAAFSYRNRTYHLWLSGVKDGGYLVSPLPRTTTRDEAIISVYFPAILMFCVTSVISIATRRIDLISLGLTTLMAAMAFVAHKWRRKDLPRLRKERLDEVYKFLQRRRESTEAGHGAPLFSAVPFKKTLVLAENVPPVVWIVIGIVEMIVCLILGFAKH